jgi:hypothetical protein
MQNDYFAKAKASGALGGATSTALANPPQFETKDYHFEILKWPK